MARPKKKVSANKAGTAKKPRASTAKMLMLAKPKAGKQERRPPNNPDVPEATINQLNSDLNDIKSILDDYSQHLRALDRKRLNGVGMRKLGFIEHAYEVALENGEFLPHYLTLDRFGNDIHYFVEFQALTTLCDQIREKLWNITLQSADIAYTDALEFYASVREAAKRRVDAAETIYNDLSTFFKHVTPVTDEPTQKKLKRDINSLIKGKHDGKVFVESIAPKIIKGKRKIIDEKFTDTAQFKETDSGTIKE